MWLSRLATNLFGFCYDPLDFTHEAIGNGLTSDQIWIISDGYYAWVYSLLQLIIGIITVIGNLFVICSIFAIPKRHRLHHKHSKPSLALADFCLGSTLTFESIVDMSFDCPLPKYRKNPVTQYLILIFMTISYYHLTFMSICRYKAVSNPFTQAKTTRKKIIGQLASLWICPVLIHALMFGLQEYIVDLQLLRFIVLGKFMLGSFFPFIATVSSALVMYLSYRWQPGALEDPMPETLKKMLNDDHANVVKTICFVVIGYSLTCIPYLIFWGQITLHFWQHNQCCPYSVVKNFQGTLMATNGIVDVIVYNFMDEHFQKYARKKLCFFRHRRWSRKRSTVMETYHTNVASTKSKTPN